jgi:large subunit ribosomal protein L36
MKYRSSLQAVKKRDKDNRLIKRKGRLMIINKKNPRMKVTQA